MLIKTNDMKKRRLRRAQTIIEYLLVLGVTTAIALVAFRNLVPTQRVTAEGYFNHVVIGLYGDPPNASGISPPGPPAVSPTKFNLYP